MSDQPLDPHTILAEYDLDPIHAIEEGEALPADGVPHHQRSDARRVTPERERDDVEHQSRVLLVVEPALTQTTRVVVVFVELAAERLDLLARSRIGEVLLAARALVEVDALLDRSDCLQVLVDLVAWIAAANHQVWIIGSVSRCDRYLHITATDSARCAAQFWTNSCAQVKRQYVMDARCTTHGDNFTI